MRKIKRIESKRGVIGALAFFIFVIPLVGGTISTQSNRQENSFPTGEGFWHTGLPQAVQRAWQSTVQIRVILIPEKAGTRRKPMVGSGIILDYDPRRQEALIVTTNHCINLQTKRPHQYEVRIPRKPNKNSKKETYYSTRNVSIVMSHPHKDLVYLKIKYPSGAHPTTALLKYTDNKSTFSGNVISIGFPILRLRQKKSWNVSIPKNYRKTMKRFSIGKLLGKGHSRNRVYILAHNADILAGNSGGPLVDNEGKIIGVNAGVFDFNGKNKANGSHYDYSPGSHDRFYFAISTSEVLKDIETIRENQLWQGSEKWLVEIAQLKDKPIENL